MATRRTPAKYDFRHQLFDEVLLPTSGSKRRSSPRTMDVKHIDIHHMTIPSTNNGGANLACVRTWKTREASAHYGVDKNYVMQFVFDNRVAWGNANALGNHEGIIVEHANKTMGPNWEIDHETLATSAKLVAGLHITHELGRPTSRGFGSGGTIRTHQSFYATACPGPYFKKYWEKYVAMVQREYTAMTSKPTKPTPGNAPVRVSLIHWNIAGSDVVNGYQKANGYRGDDVARHAKDLGFYALFTCEAGQSDLRAGMNKILGKLNPWESAAKAIWYRSDRMRLLEGRKTYSTGRFAFKKTQKYGAGFFAVHEGKKFAVLEVHTDYRKPASQSKQLRQIFRQWNKDCNKHRIPRKNRVVVGDFNWDGSKGDDPFKALDRYGFVEHGNKSAATFLNGQHLDGVLAHPDAELNVQVKPRSNGKINLSDHFPIRIILTLV